MSSWKLKAPLLYHLLDSLGPQAKTSMGIQYLFAVLLYFVAALANPVSNTVQKYSGCELEQKGFHLKLRCSLTPGRSGSFDDCYFGVDIANEAFVNPYEVSDKMPELKFTIFRRARESQGGLFSSLTSRKPVEHMSVQEIAINASEVDIEAPSWKADSNKWKFSFDSITRAKGADSAAIELAIPLHLRYSLPSPSGKPRSGLVMRAFSEQCESGLAESGLISGIYNVGCHSDLLLVLPITVILLVIGVFILAFHR